MATTDLDSLTEETSPAAGDWVVVERPATHTKKLDIDWFTSATGAGAGLDAHLTDAVGAHAASAISATAGTRLTTTDVQGQLSQADTELGTNATAISDHEASSTAHAALDVTFADAGRTYVLGATVQAALNATDTALIDHITDATDAHDASAVSIADAGSVFAATEVEAALQEIVTATAAPNQAQVLTYEVGDTGWQDVVLDVENSWTATALELRRTGNMVEMRISVGDGSSSTAPTIYTLPDGFRPDFDELMMGVDQASITPSASATVISIRVQPAGGILIDQTVTDARAVLVFSTTDTWPATLPGAG